MGHTHIFRGCNSPASITYHLLCCSVAVTLCYCPILVFYQSIRNNAYPRGCLISWILFILLCCTATNVSQIPRQVEGTPHARCPLRTVHTASFFFRREGSAFFSLVHSRPITRSFTGCYTPASTAICIIYILFCRCFAVTIVGF